MRRFAAVALGAATAAVLTAPDSRAALHFSPCGDRITCATLQVPIDRSNSVGGLFSLHIERERARSRPGEGAIFAITGGPGESATARTKAFARELAPALKTRDLIVFDQRGTGRSDPLHCADLERTQCAEIGAKLHFYTTRDSADDIESIRRALSVRRIALYGVSYGTKVALAYAKRYPEHVERLVLDSVVPLDGFDFFDLDSYRAVTGILRAECSANACAHSTDDVVTAVGTLAALAQTGTLKLPAIARDGEPRPTDVRVNQYELFHLVFAAASADAVVRARLPAAVEDALAGDGYPLSRLLPADGRALDAAAEPVNEALRRATLCEELPPPWWRTATYGVRRLKTADLLNATSAAVFQPFTRDSAFDGDPLNACLGWEVAPAAPTIDGPGMPDVPVLILNGIEDALTPLAGAQGVAALFRQATLVAVPDMGHAVIPTAVEASAVSSSAACARAALSAFFAGTRVHKCTSRGHAVAPAARGWDSLDDVPAYHGVKGRPGRMLGAVMSTLADVAVTAKSLNTYRVGLRGGTFALDRRTFRLRDVINVPGVVVSGSYSPAPGIAHLSIAGVSSGTVDIDRHGWISVRFGATRFRVHRV